MQHGQQVSRLDTFTFHGSVWVKAFHSPTRRRAADGSYVPQLPLSLLPAPLRPAAPLSHAPPRRPAVLTPPRAAASISSTALSLSLFPSLHDSLSFPPSPSESSQAATESDLVGRNGATAALIGFWQAEASARGERARDL